MDDTPAERSSRAWFDWMFRDRQTGRTTIAQVPNLPLWIFLATAITRRVLDTDSNARAASSWVGVAALGWWAVDEVLRGVNPWRRLLGLAGCAVVVASVRSLLLG